MYHNNIIHRVAWFLRNPNSPPHRPQPTSQPVIRAHRKMYNPSTPSKQQQQRPNEITQPTERPGLHISNNGFINSKINRFHLCLVVVLVRCRVSWRLEVEDSDEEVVEQHNTEEEETVRELTNAAAASAEEWNDRIVLGFVIFSLSRLLSSALKSVLYSTDIHFIRYCYTRKICTDRPTTELKRPPPSLTLRWEVPCNVSGWEMGNFRGTVFEKQNPKSPAMTRETGEWAKTLSSWEPETVKSTSEVTSRLNLL